jgi:cytochrome P450
MSDAAEAVLLELLTTPEGRRDPYPRYHRLRELAPVHRSPNLGLWFLTRYEDCSAALRDPRIGKDYPRQMQLRFGPKWREHPALLRGERSLLNLDGADHSRLRKLVVKAFTRRTVEALRPRIEQAVNALLDPFAEAGGGDILDALAFPMPITVIGDLLGVPEADRPPFRRWVADLTAVLETRPTDAQLAAADEATLAISGYFDDLVEEKRRRPDGALLSRLVHLDADGDRFSRDELSNMASLVFNAGFETTTNLIGNSLLGLLRQGDQLALLRERPELIPALPDELLRFDGTAQMTARDTHAEVEIGGTKIPAGATVFAILGAANHDPAEFPDPDRIDVTRGRFHPLSFGGGAHFCLGASLAKAEIEITFRSLLERFESIELVGEPRFRDRLTLRGLESLEVAVRSGTRRDVRPAAPAERVTVPVTQTVAESPGAREIPVEQVRPSQDVEADRIWRNALRARVETGVEDAMLRTGPDLTATIVLLARADLFRACKPEEIEDLASTSYPMSFEPGDRLCVEGAESLECYVIQEGEADVTIGGRHVRQVGVNEVVGERGVLERSARSATVTATSHMLAYAISRERLLAIVEKSPEAKDRMFAYMRGRYED